MSLMDEIVITDANRAGFEPVAKIFKDHAEPVRMMIYGPKGSGKTTLAQARGREFDLMSEKNISFINAAELVSFFNLGEVGERFLEQAGTVEILIIDAFQDFYASEVGPMLCKLLVNARNMQGFETVIFSDVPFAELDFDVFEGVLDSFDKVEVAPLDKADHIDFAQRIQKELHGYDEEFVSLDDEALNYVTYEFAKDLDDVRNALKFLITSGNYEAGTVLTVADVKEVLTA